MSNSEFFVIVRYAAPETLVFDLVSSLCRDSSVVVVVNNGPPMSVDRIADGEKIVFLENGNVDLLAGAYSKALSFINGISSDHSLVTFLDDDTDVAIQQNRKYRAWVREKLCQQDIAAVSPVYFDRSTGLVARYKDVNTGKFFDRNAIGEASVVSLINSNATWRMSVLRELGDFDNRFPIDFLDVDRSVMARYLGYRLIVNYSFRFCHSIGNRTTFKFIGIQGQTSNHSPFRRKMIGRGIKGLLRKYGLRDRTLFWDLLFRVLYEVLGIMHERDHRLAKMLAFVGGCLGR